MKIRSIFQSMANFKKNEILGIGIGFVSKLFGLLNQLFAVPLLTISLGTSGTREYLLAISAVSWFNLTLFGLGTSLPIALARSRHASVIFDKFVKTGFIIALFGSLGAIFISLILLSTGTFPQIRTQTMIVSIICNSMILIFGPSEKTLQSLEKFALFNVLGVVGTTLSIILTYIFYLYRFNSDAFVFAYYVSALFPAVSAAVFILPHLVGSSFLPLEQFYDDGKKLLKAGIFGFGYEFSSFCKMQAPVLILSLMNLTGDFLPINFGIKLIVILNSGISTIVPIMLVGATRQNQGAGRSSPQNWYLVGVASALSFAVFSPILFIFAGRFIVTLWTKGVVTLGPAEVIGLAVFSSAHLAQLFLFPLVAAIEGRASRFRWLFWAEGALALIASTVGAVLVPPAFSGAGALFCAGLVIGLSDLLLLNVLVRQIFNDVSARSYAR